MLVEQYRKDVFIRYWRGGGEGDVLIAYERKRFMSSANGSVS